MLMKTLKITSGNEKKLGIIFLTSFISALLSIVILTSGR